MPVSNLNLYLSRGDNRTFTVTAQDYNQNIINLTSVQAIVCTGRLDPLDTNPIFTKSIGSGITVTNAASGVFNVTLAPADTNSLTDYDQSLYYDVKVTDSLSNVTTVQGGKIYLSANISH